jgi:hypothetical protein
LGLGAWHLKKNNNKRDEEKKGQMRKDRRIRRRATTEQYRWQEKRRAQLTLPQLSKFAEKKTHKKGGGTGLY